MKTKILAVLFLGVAVAFLGGCSEESGTPGEKGTTPDKSKKKDFFVPSTELDWSVGNLRNDWTGIDPNNNDRAKEEKGSENE